MRHAVVLVLQPQPVPVHGGVQVAAVGDMNDHFGSLLNTKGGAGDRAVVAEHPYGAVAKPLGYRRYVKAKRVAIGKLEDLGCRGLGEACGIGRE